MQFSRGFPLAASCLLAAAAAPAPAQDSPAYGAGPRTAEIVPEAVLRSYVAVTVNGLVSHSATADAASHTLIVRRDGPGDPEIHLLLNDVLVARTGTASLVVGGRLEGGRETAPNEWRGGTIVGGRRYDLHPGDVVWIPAGIPHQMLVARGTSFTYLAVKTDKAP